MEDLKRIWTDQYKINSYDADTNNRASLVHICNYLQESAWRHANHLGLGYRTTTEIEQVWVIVRLLITMKQYPLWDDTITIKTWPRGVEGFMALRDFQILNQQGIEIGAASSQWLILDVNTRKPQHSRVVQDILPLATCEPAMREKPEKIVIRGPLRFADSNIAQYGDLDMNGHVNNARYIEWILNIFPPEIHSTNFICSLLIEFLAESMYGDEIQLYSSVTNQISLIRGIRTEDDKTIFRARLHFMKK